MSLAGKQRTRDSGPTRGAIRTECAKEPSAVCLRNGRQGKSQLAPHPEQIRRKLQTYFTITTKYLLVDQKICGLVMRRMYCLLASCVSV